MSRTSSFDFRESDKVSVPMVEKRGDRVYTPEWVARDMAWSFQPSGRVLEPCKGKGVFLRFLPDDTEWCEIDEGRDFFEWHEKVDWVVSYHALA